MNELKKISENNINITIYKDDEVLSPFSDNGTETITSELAEYIKHSAKSTNPKHKQNITIFSKNLNDTQKEKYAMAIKNYFSRELAETKRMLKRNTITSIIFGLISILTFLFHFSFIEKLNISTLKELILIFGWVFLWEAIDLLFIQGYKLRILKYRYKNIVNAKISFKELNSKNKTK